MILTLNTVIPFFHRTLQLMMLYYQTKFGCKPTSSLEGTTEIVIFWYQTKFVCKLTSTLEDTTEIVIFWLYKPLLWPWHWTQWINFSAWHFGFWCCITIPGLATKCSVVQKISSGQTLTNILKLCCDLGGSKSIFQRDTAPYDAVLSSNNHILII